MRYSYHGRIFQRIRAGELVGFHFEDHYPGIGEAMVLEFSTLPPLRPIRPHKWPEYVRILDEWRAKKERPEGGASRRSVQGLASENDNKIMITCFARKCKSRAVREGVTSR